MLLPIQTNIWKKIMIIRSQLFFKNFVIVLSWFISQILWTAIIPLIFHSCHLFLHLPHPHLSPLPLLPQIQLRSTNGTKLTAGSFRGKPWAQIFLIRIQFGKRYVKGVFFLPYLVRSCNDIICKRLVSCFNFLKCFQVGKNLPLEGIFDCEDIRREFSIMPSQGRKKWIDFCCSIPQKRHFDVL